MALSGSETAQSLALRSRTAGSSAAARALAIVGPLLLILLWTAAVRLPFYRIANGDEFFFSVVAREWLRGGLPYVDAFDIKPPGLFFVYAVAQAIFGASYATFKGMEIVAVALGAWALYVMLRPFASGRLALWSAALFPVYTLAFGGTSSINMLLQLPFVIAAFGAVMTATDGDVVLARRLRAAFLAGLAIGAAGMIKQTAIFEAAAAFALLWAYGVSGSRVKMLALLVVGAALPALAFSAYFLAVGHFRDMFDSIIVLASQRLDADVIRGYGPEYAHWLTLEGATANAFLRSLPLVLLWGAALFALLRIDRIRSLVPLRIVAIVVSWLAASFVAAVFGRMLCDYYLLGIVAPLLILAGLFFCCGMRLEPSRRRVALWASLVLAGATLVYAEHRQLFGANPFLVDNVLDAKTIAAFRKLGLERGDRLLVLNRGMELYTETGARPPTPYFHTTQLMSAFHTPVADPLGDALEANPRFIVMADPTLTHIYELPARFKRAEDYLAAHYRVAATVQGETDSFTIYEFVD